MLIKTTLKRERGNMKKAIFALFFLLVFSGCFETKFNFKTVIHRNGKTDREVRIDGRGANRFLPPSGPQWLVKTFETKGGETILEDRQYHIEAQGHFKSPSEITSDFRYDVSKLVANVTDQTRKEFQNELGIKEPFDKEIRAANHVDFQVRRKFLTTEYDYTEIFQNRWIIPILLHDLKKELIRKETVAIQAPNTGIASQAPAIAMDPTLLSSDRIEKLAEKKLKEEVLPQFQFHSEITLPGTIVSSNATQTHGPVAVWDFRGTDFQKNFSTYTLQVKSKAYNISTLVALAVLALLILVLILLSFREKKEVQAVRRRKG